jgi:hypothetical protein
MQKTNKDSAKENATLGKTMKHIEGEDNTWREDITWDRALRRYVFLEICTYTSNNLFKLRSLTMTN